MQSPENWANICTVLIWMILYGTTSGRPEQAGMRARRAQSTQLEYSYREIASTSKCFPGETLNPSKRAASVNSVSSSRDYVFTTGSNWAFFTSVRWDGLESRTTTRAPLFARTVMNLFWTMPRHVHAREPAETRSSFHTFPRPHNAIFRWKRSPRVTLIKLRCQITVINHAPLLLTRVHVRVKVIYFCVIAYCENRVAYNLGHLRVINVFH